MLQLTKNAVIAVVVLHDCGLLPVGAVTYTLDHYIHVATHLLEAK